MWRIVVPVVASIALAVAAPAADTAKVGDIAIDQPWARGYMILQNTGAVPDRLIGGSTPVATQVQLHTHVMEGGVAKMRPVDAIEVAPGQPTVLEPGGAHVMLQGLTQKLEEGTTMPLTLVFEHAGKVTLEVPVEGIMAGRGPGHDDSMDHGEHGSD